MSEKWYMANRYNEIVPVSVVKVTEKMITYKDTFGGTSTQAIRSSYNNFFDSLDDAKAFAIERITEKMARLETDLQAIMRM